MATSGDAVFALKLEAAWAEASLKILKAELQDVAPDMELYKAFNKHLKGAAQSFADINVGMLENLNSLDQANKKLLGQMAIRKRLGKSISDLIPQHIEINKQIEEQYGKISECGDATGYLMDRLSRIADHSKHFAEEMAKTAINAKNVAAGLNAIGLGGIGKLVQGFSSLGGAVSMVISGLKEYYKVELEVSNTQYRMMGSTYAATQFVYGLSRSYGVSRESALAATKAIAEYHIQMKPDVLKKYAGEMAMLSEITGASAQAMGQFTARMMAAGSSSGDASKALNQFALQARSFGVTGQELDSLMKKIGDKALFMNQSFGAGAPAKYGQMLTFLSGKAKELGLSIEEVTGLMDNSEESQESLALALGADSIWKTPEQNMKDYVENFDKNSQRINNIAASMPPAQREKFLKPFMAMNKVAEKLWEKQGDRSKMTAEQFKEAQKNVMKGLEEQGNIEKQAQEKREAAAASLTAFMSSLTSVAAGIATILQPVVVILTKLSEWFIYLNNISGGVFGYFVTALIGTLIIAKKFGIGFIKDFINPIRGGLKNAAKDVTVGVGKNFAAGAKSFAQGIWDFCKIFKEGAVDIIIGTAVFSLAVFMLGAALVGIGFLAKLAGADILSAALALIPLAIAIYIVGQVSQQLAGVMPGFLFFLAAAVLMGIGILAVAGAMAITGVKGGELLMAAIAVIALVGAMAIVGAAGIGLGAEMPGFLFFLAAAILMGLAVFAIGIALTKSGTDGASLLKAAMAIVLLVGALTIIGAVGLIGGLLMIAGALAMGAGFLALGGALLILKSAVMPNVPTEDQMKVLSMIGPMMAGLGLSLLVGVGSLIIGAILLFYAGILMSKSMVFMLTVGILAIAAMFALWLFSRLLTKVADILVNRSKDLMVGATALQILATSLQTLMDLDRSGLKKFASAYDDMMGALSKSSNKYGPDINRALYGLTMAGQMGAFGGAFGAAKPSAGTISTINPIAGFITGIMSSLFGEKKEDNSTELRKIKETLQSINGKLDNLGGGNASEILEQLKMYLPEIADKDTGLRAAPTTNWQN